MGILKNIFGKNTEASKNEELEPQNDPNLIRVYDKYGREMFITKEQWRTNVLPGTLKSNWNDPQQLYGIIVQSLNDGFRADVIKAAEQLYKTDPQPVRGTAVWGIVLMEEDRLDEAEKVFQTFISRHGEDGIILTNLSKVFSKRKNDVKAEETLWHALEIDPNQDNGMGWYYAIHQERGEQAGTEALRKISALPGSWRAQLWLARNALQAHRLDEALKMYQECLARVSKPVPADLLMQMSGDLGNAGFLSEILQLCEPYFVVETHGLQVGNNLIKAHLDLGQIESAQKILNQLYSLKRPNYQQTLSYWDTEIAKARLSKNTDQNASMEIVMLSGEGPVWLKPESAGTELFPVKKSDEISVCFLGSSADSDAQKMQHQLADTRGRLSRAIPLFLAEQLNFNSNARTQTLVPWITQNDSAGFVLSGVAWANEDVVKHMPQSDYAVITHLKCSNEPWALELRLVRVSDGKCLGNLNASFPPAKPEVAVPQLSQDLLKLLMEQVSIKTIAPTPLYKVPTGVDFPYYLLRLEQLLAVRCSGMDGVQSNFLSGEREIIDGNIQLCLAHPKNVITRLLLAKTVAAMKLVRPDILPEFKDKLFLLQKDRPLLEPAQGIIQKVFG